MNKKLTTPVLFAASVPVVFVLVLAAIIFTDTFGYFHTWKRVGDLDALGALLLAGTPIFAAVSLSLLRWEALKHLNLTVHLRQSSILYTAAGLIGVWLVSNLDDSNGLHYAYATGLFSVMLFGIVVNAAVVGWLRRYQKNRAT